MTTNAKAAALEALIEAHAVELKLPTVRRRFRALAAEPLDAVITDQKLGDGAGLDVLAAARESDPPRPAVFSGRCGPFGPSWPRRPPAVWHTARPCTGGPSTWFAPPRRNHQVPAGGSTGTPSRSARREAGQTRPWCGRSGLSHLMRGSCAAWPLSPPPDPSAKRTTSCGRTATAHRPHWPGI